MMVFSLALDVARSSANSKMLELVLNKLVKEVLPDEIAKTVLAKDSNLAHLYGLPKTHKPCVQYCQQWVPTTINLLNGWMKS